MDVDSALGAAMRRRQRRLRQFLRHERLSVAMALAEKLHHTSRGQRFARAGEMGREEHDALRRQRHPPPQPELFQLYEEEPGGSRPACLAEPRGPQKKVQQCTLEQLADVVLMVQVLDAPGWLEEDVVVEVLRMLDVPAVKQVIAVPKILQDRTPQRLGDRLRQPQTAEQLMEVPTDVSYSTLQQLTAEQIVDIPVPGRAGGGGRGGLQGFPGQGSTAHGAEFVNIPVPQGRGGLGGGGLQGFSQGQGSTAFYVADHADFPFPHGRVGGGGLQGFLPGQGSAASSSHVGSADEAGQGFFRTFLRWKKSAGLGPHSGSELGADFNPWIPAAYAESMAGAYDVAVEESEAAGWWWRRVLRLALQLAFSQCGSARVSSSTSWDGPCGRVPTAIGALSHTHGLSFTRKPQPMSSSSRRAFRTEAVVAVSGPGGRGWLGRWGGREERRRGAAVQKTVTMVVDVLVLFYDKFRSPESSFWRCLSSSSFSEGGTFQLRRRDRSPLPCLLSSGGELATEGGVAAGGFVCFLAGGRGTLVVSPCELVSVTALHLFTLWIYTR